MSQQKVKKCRTNVNIYVHNKHNMNKLTAKYVLAHKDQFSTLFKMQHFQNGETQIPIHPTKLPSFALSNDFNLVLA